MKNILLSLVSLITFSSFAQVIDLSEIPQISVTDSIIAKEIKLIKKNNDSYTILNKQKKLPKIINVSTAAINSDNNIYDVGKINITTTVNEMGATVHEVPLSLPNGRKDCIPEISLVYNSLSQNGILGWGWSIKGLSMLRPTNFSQYYDGKVSPIALDTAGVFILDGTRLIKKDTDLYLSEQGNIKVRSEIEDGLINSFHVNYPDGKIAEYVPVFNDGIEYPISRLTDIYGNHIDYDYDYDIQNKLHYISSISYGGRGDKNNSGHYVFIEFHYIDGRPDSTNTYTAGVKQKNNRLLDEIVIKYQQQVLRIYKFTYKNDPTVLTEINCWSENYEKRLPPLQFTYGYNRSVPSLNSSTATVSTYYESMDNMIISTGKIRYGSDDDGILVYPDPGLSYNPVEEYYYVSLIPEHEFLLYPNLGSGTNYALTLTTGAGFMKAFVSNVIGTADDEIVKINNIVENGNDVVSVSIYDQEYLSGSLPVKKNIKYISGRALRKKNTDSFCPKVFLPGDFDGDGKNEIFAVSMMNPMEITQNSKCLLLDLEDEAGPVFNEYVFNFNYGHEILVPVDFDGDGKIDICHIGENFWNFYSFKKESDKWILEQIYSRPYSPINPNSMRYLFTDINGDRKTDILVAPNATIHRTREVPVYSPKECPDCHGQDFGYEGINSNTGIPDIWCFSCEKYIQPADYCIDCMYPVYNTYECPTHGKTVEYTFKEYDYLWDIWISTGYEYAYNKQVSFSIEKDDDLITQDMDNDGIQDIIVRKKLGAYNILEVHLIKSGVISSAASSKLSCRLPEGDIILSSSTVTQALNHMFLYGLDKNKVYKINYDDDQGERRLLTRVINSMGSQTDIYFQKMNVSEQYIKGNSSIYPYIDFNGPVWITESLQTYSKGNEVDYHRYTYEEAVVNLQGLGFCGFKTFTDWDVIRTKSRKRSFDPYQFRSLLTDSSEETLWVGKYQIVKHEDKRVQVLLTESVETDRLNGNIQKTTYTYDDLGYPIKENVDYGENFSKEVTWIYNHFDNDTLYNLGVCIWELIKKRKTDTKQEVAECTVRSYDKNIQVGESVYYASDMRLFNRRRKHGIVQVYDENMNIKEKKTFYYLDGNTPLVEKWEYDALGRVIKDTNPVGLEKAYQYDAFGNILTEQDNKNRKIHYTYDVWGRQVSVIYPDATTEKITRAWTETPINAKTVETIEKSGEPVKKIFYDTFGREIRQSEERFDGKFLNIDKIYDTWGRLYKTSLPSRSDAPSLWNETEYDRYDRPIRKHYASGKNEIYEYGQNTIKEIKNGITVTKTYNSLKQLIKISDATGDIVYDLRVDGLPMSITSPGGVVTSFKYTPLRQKEAISDPSAGLIQLTYFSNGLLKSRKEANGNETQYEYDIYRRKIKQTILKAGQPESVTSFVYDNENRLKSAIDNRNIGHTYVYDNLGRLQSDTTIIKENRIYRTYKYNSSGKVGVITYGSEKTSPVTVENGYVKGHKIAIRVGKNKIAWRLSTENDMGLPSKTITGPLTRTFEYDEFGFPTGKVVKCGSRVIQDISMSFDYGTGNLKWRKDNVRNLKEDFGYDELNRLISFDGKTITYDVKGNILNHSEVGEFEYSESKPYAIETVNLYGNGIPSDVQEISYNGLSLPEKISEGGQIFNFLYDYAGVRVMSGNKFYLENKYEERSDTQKDSGVVLYLDGDAYSASVVLSDKYFPWEEKGLIFLCRDHLGSITHIVNENGFVEQELSYDPWGRLRNPDTHELYSREKEPSLALGRGYCGHIHLQNFGLIDMNARLYDPVIGRFLSPDPYVQMPDFSQNFNRYTYCLNNPLVYKDENGKWIFSLFLGPVGVIIDAALWSATINYVSQGIANLATKQCTLKEAFTSHIDFFDVFVSGITGGITAGLGTSSQVVKTMKYVTPLLTNTFEYKVGEGFSIAPYQEIIVGTVADVGMTGFLDWKADKLGKMFPSKTDLPGKSWKNSFLKNNYKSFTLDLGASTGSQIGAKVVSTRWMNSIDNLNNNISYPIPTQPVYMNNPWWYNLPSGFTRGIELPEEEDTLKEALSL